MGRTISLDSILRFLAVTMACVFCIPAMADDGQVWLSGAKKLWQSDNKATKVILYGEMRTADNFADISGVFWGPIVRHKINPYLAVGGAYKFINLPKSGGQVNLNRWEFEVTPGFSFGSDSQFKVALRNRFEVITDKGKANKNRLRHRLTLSKSIKNSEHFKGIYTSHELIYITNGTVTIDGVTSDRSSHLDQYRLTPLGVKLKHFNLKLFYMINRKNNAAGDYNHVLGLNFSF
ncbi:MAG: DUF2490 domain-containing protein [Psychrosphaera sp.]|nr:DUF2490 domain-containing protein [Psychrosphaera sp.]